MNRARSIGVTKAGSPQSSCVPFSPAPSPILGHSRSDLSNKNHPSGQTFSACCLHDGANAMVDSGLPDFHTKRETQSQADVSFSRASNSLQIARQRRNRKRPEQ
jgi:hypothetical protein